MKRKIIFISALMAMLLAVGCGSNNSVVTINKESLSPVGTVLNDEERTTSGQVNEDDVTPITLTVGDKVLNGYLNSSAPAKSLIEMLPLNVSLNDSDNDFCGGNIDIKYSESDIQNGYKNGDLAFWPPASNFVIFVDDEENSANTDNLVILGRITETQDVLDSLSGRLDVTIKLADDNSNKENNSTNNEEVSEVKVKITVGDTELISTWEDNATTRELIRQMPMTLPMMDLYGREMCYRYGAYALPTDDMRSDGYEVGDIAYWAPGGSLVILYEQNGEKFERQHIGHIDSGIEIFKQTGDVNVRFEVMN